MAVNPYDEPQVPFDPNRPPGPLVDGGPGSVPVPGYSETVNVSGNRGGGVPLLGGLVNFFKLFGKIPNPFHRGSSTPNSSTPSSSQGQPSSSTTPSTGQQLVGMTPEILATILALLNKPQDTNANNPALSGLNAAVPQLTAQLNALLQNDVQRRQMSDPLYSAVLRGAMGGLPVWMRGGSSSNPTVGSTSYGPFMPPADTVVPPPTVGGAIPSTPAWNLYTPAGDNHNG
jgi:hypothetical protein